MNMHNIFDLDWSLAASVERRTQFYRKSLLTVLLCSFIASIILQSNGE